MLEAVITVAIVAVLATVMIPPLFEQTQAARVDATAREMAASVRLARAEARARNRLVYIGANNNDWSNGWRVWIDDNDETFVSGGSDVLLFEVIEVANSMRLAFGQASGAIFRISNSGYVETRLENNLWRPRELTFTICEQPHGRRLTITRRVHTSIEVIPNDGTC